MRIFIFLLGVLLALPLGWKELIDPDLGWHLATGRWIMAHGTLPTADPFTLDARFYLAYSWLFDLGVWFVFSAGGFVALQLCQLLLITWCVVECFRSSEERGLPAVLLLLFPLIAPLFHLRPQLLSAIFFLLLLRRSQPAGSQSRIWDLGVGVLWANIHVYWILLPVTRLFLAERASDRRWAIALFSVGMLNPYGLQLYAGMAEYLLNHDAAHRLIREFQPLSFDLGYVPFLFAPAVWLTIVAPGPMRTRLFQALLAALGVLRFKYLPLFALAAIPTLSRRLAPLFPAPVFSLPPLPPRDNSPITKGQLTSIPLHFTWLQLIFISLALGALSVTIWWTFPAELTSFTVERSAFLESARKIECPQTVLTHFDDGGWGEFALPECRVVYDGRTLVMGEKRLAEFDQFRRTGCGPISDLRITAALLPTEFYLQKLSCFQGWREESRGPITLLERLPLERDPH